MAGYLLGLGVGYDWANVAFQKEKGERLYCPPDQLALNLANLQNILEARLAKQEERKAKSGDAAPILIEYELLRGLRDTFPCR